MIPLLLVLTFLYPSEVRSAAIDPVQAPVSLPDATSTPDAYVAVEARKWGVDETLALYVWNHEGGGDLHARGDLTPMADGIPAIARGPWQITRKYHPEVPDSCTDDLECSTEWAMPRLKNKKTCMNEFSTCRDYFADK